MCNISNKGKRIILKRYNDEGKFVERQRRKAVSCKWIIYIIRGGLVAINTQVCFGCFFCDMSSAHYVWMFICQLKTNDSCLI